MSVSSRPTHLVPFGRAPFGIVLLLAAIVIGSSTRPAEALTAEDRSNQLVALARKEFTNLTSAEIYLIRTVCTGKPCDYSEAFEDERATSPTWAKELLVRNDRLEWLCSSTSATVLVPHQGVVLKAARIQGRLDLSFAKVPFPLTLEDCQLTAGMNLGNAELKELSLAGTRCGELLADGVRIERDLALDYGFIATGEVRLAHARIGGDFDASGGEFLNPGPDAIFAEGLVIAGDLNLRYGFKATGRIDLRHAKIGGHIDAEGGEFLNPDQIAFYADAIHVTGDVRLRDGFLAKGAISLESAKVGGRLILTGGRVERPSKSAIIAEGLSVDSDVLLNGGFVALGCVDLTGSEIDGDLVCTAANFFAGVDGAALRVSRGSIEGDVLFTSTPKLPWRAEGDLDFHSARVTGTFRWEGIEDAKTVGLDLRSSRLGRLWFEAEGWPTVGRLHLDGLTYDIFYNASSAEVETLVDWIRRQPVDRFRPQPYEQLSAAVRKDGHEDAAQSILIAKEEDRMRELSPTRQWIHRVLGVTIGYGYDPWRALWIGTVIVVWGAFVFAIGSRLGLIAATKEVEHVCETPDVSPRLSRDYPSFNALVYSLDMFVPLLDLQQANYWLPSAQRGRMWGAGPLRLRTGSTLRLYLGIHIYLGWALTTLLAVGLSGLVQS